MSRYTCEHFRLEELVPPEVFAAAEHKDVLWMLFDPLALQILDGLRNYFGPIIVNNWHAEGPYRSSGFRTNLDGGAQFSQHKYGRAFDCKFRDATPVEVQESILADTYLKNWAGITRLEDARITQTWLHFDVGNHTGPIKVFKP